MPIRRKEHSVAYRLNRMLNNNHAASKRRFDVFISVLVLISTAIVFAGGFSQHEASALPAWLMVVDYIILGIFLIEYLARLAFAMPELPRAIRLSRYEWWRLQIQARIKWMFTPMAIIDFLAVLPLFALDHSLSNFKLFRVIRILRLMRLYRLVSLYNPLEKLGKAFRNNTLLYVVAFSLVAITIAMGSVSFYVVEGTTNSNVENPFDAIWWTVVTLTTVGYGDTVPTTILGKVVAIALMLSGVILMAVFAGVMSQTMVGYLLDVREERVRMSSTVNHIIICGWNSRGPMVAEELKHLAPEEEIIIFANVDEPLDLPEAVTFVRGNPTKESEWDRVRLSAAQNIVVLAPPNDQETASDGSTALVIYTIRAYEGKLAKRGINRSIPLRISAELLDPENYQHIIVAGADEVVHTAQVGSNLIAHSSVKPGMAKVVTELLSWWGQGIDLEPVPDEIEDGTDFLTIATEVRREMNYLVVGLMNPNGSISLNPSDRKKVTKEHKLIVIRRHDELEEHE